MCLSSLIKEVIFYFITFMVYVSIDNKEKKDIENPDRYGDTTIAHVRAS